MQLRRLGWGLGSALIGLLAHAAPLSAQAAPTASVAYAADSSDFPNPERGFSEADGDLAGAQAAGFSLVHVYFRLDPYRDAPLPPAYLRQVRRTFADARKSGVKLVPRFTYNFPDGEPYGPEDADAPLVRVLQHLDQLAPVLKDNSDVIAFMEAGFIGAWGEWHHSQNGLESEDAKREIAARLLSIMPATRAVALRYPPDKALILQRSTALRPAEAFSGSDAARLGHHNDCFLSSASNGGTYQPSDPASVRAQKRYLAAENRFVPQGGETCSAGVDAQAYIGCDNAVAELAAQHWSQLNADYEPEVLAGWREQGCFETIARRLGYRFRLTGATLETVAHPGGVLRGMITLVNDGFASPYNPRGLELVLRDHDTGETIALPVTDDPRRWSAGEAHTIVVKVRLPDSLPQGDYEVLLNLPDPEPTLHDRPAYAIRLANVGLWEPATGYNALKLGVTVR